MGGARGPMEGLFEFIEDERAFSSSVSQ